MVAWGRRDEHGVSAVEFALVFPLVFALMFGIVQYSLYFWGRQTAAAAAREAARRMAVGTEWTCAQAEASTRASDAGKDVDVALAYDNASNTAVVGNRLTVTVRVTSLTPDFFPLPDSGVISEVATQRVHNIPATPLQFCPDTVNNLPASCCP